MPRYKVIEVIDSQDIITNTYHIEAESEEEARKMVILMEVDPDDISLQSKVYDLEDITVAQI